ncbi:putative SP-containing protein [Vairimorpha necatrix]|uniref:SP-containing protein n=1 Tax=Vairimorpha necatrix TaxID=6039 RepID=A0AAX4JCS2_9MICR
MFFGLIIVLKCSNFRDLKTTEKRCKLKLNIIPVIDNQSSIEKYVYNNADVIKRYNVFLKTHYSDILKFLLFNEKLSNLLKSDNEYKNDNIIINLKNNVKQLRKILFNESDRWFNSTDFKDVKRYLNNIDDLKIKKKEDLKSNMFIYKYLSKYQNYAYELYRLCDNTKHLCAQMCKKSKYKTHFEAIIYLSNFVKRVKPKTVTLDDLEKYIDILIFLENEYFYNSALENM